LAALAHEVAHIAWRVTVPFMDPTTFCGGNFFAQSWTTPIYWQPWWRHLLTPDERKSLRSIGGLPDVHKNPPYIDQIDNPGTGDPKQSIYDLLAATQPWASIFSAMSPDEDFVETYKFKVLTTANPPLTSVSIKVPGFDPRADIVADYRNQDPGTKQDLKAKVGCVSLSF
jgi:hypothetical protein